MAFHYITQETIPAYLNQYTIKSAQSKYQSYRHHLQRQSLSISFAGTLSEVKHDIYCGQDLMSREYDRKRYFDRTIM